jgi:prepilin-type N-terminal cleavage/methylation domain-containing protein
MFKRLKDQRGFTLIELLVALVIIAVLTAILLAVVGRGADQRNATAVAREAQKIISGLGLYKSDTGIYPLNLRALWDRNAVPAARQAFWRGPYFSPTKITADGNNAADQRVAGVEYRYVRITTSGGTGSCSNVGQIGTNNTGGVDHVLHMSNVPFEVARLLADNFGKKGCKDSMTAETVNFYLVVEETW